MALGGLDVGTSGCKCTVMTENGTLLSSCYREYAVSRTASAHEVDAGLLWDAVREVIRGACADSPEPVTALCAASFGESVVLLDEADGVLAPVMIYTDPRGTEEAARLDDMLGAQAIFDLCGHRSSPMYSLPKLMYIKDRDPALFGRVKRILPIGAYVTYRLSGRAVTDYSLAARTMMLDIRTLDWCGPLLEAAGIDRALLPEVVPPGTAARPVAPSVAAELGLAPGAIAVVGCHDQVAACIGAGALKAGVAVNGSGTVECITPVFAGIPDGTAGMFDNGYAVVPAVKGLYVTYAFTFTGGALLQWYRDRFAAWAREEAAASGKSLYAVLDGHVRPDPTGLLVLPHFAGAATPYMDPDATGAILGLSLASDERNVYQAILEGVAYESRVNLERLAAAGIRVDSLRATGGGAKSAVWMQIKADVWGKPIDTLASAEAGTVGTILLAGVATGAYASLEEAMQTIALEGHIEPTPGRARYDAHFDRYRRVYDAVKTVYN